MSETITYAKVDGPPDDWFDLRIIDLDTGLELKDVVEVNAAKGWLIRATRNEAGELYVVGSGEGAEIARERIGGRFEIRRPG